MHLRARLDAAARELAPGAFSLVMATGIVSTAAQLLGWETISWALFALNVVFYLALLALLALRLARHRGRVLEDFRSHAVSAGFLTVVASTGVLGTEMVLRVSLPGVALALWIVAVAVWVGLIYGFFGVLTVLPEKPVLHRGINASWMLLVVSTQSVSLLGTLLAPALGTATHAVLGFATATFLLGCMFYLLLFSLILYRFLFFPIDPDELTPPYWINMGAVAITTLSGSLLILRAEHWRILRDLLPFLRGFTLMFWATATWWIPLLLLLGAWRHLARRVPLRYSVQYWSMVFPIGMYTVATARLAEALEWPALQAFTPVAGPVALVAWGLASAGLVREILRG